MTNLLRGLLHKHAWLLYYPPTTSSRGLYSLTREYIAATYYILCFNGAKL